MNPYERETVINASDGDSLIRIWTAQRTYITKMRKNAAFIEVASGRYEGSEWAAFEIAASQWSPLGVKAKRKPMTPEQREAAAERLRRARNRSETPIG